jgi:hypothetical protein
MGQEVGHARMQAQLWELAQSASQYLRRHASPAVRLAAALLLAASVAACNASPSDTTVVQTQTDTVAPLEQEVASGLPRGPGTYEVVPGSVFRDQRGVYQFEWLNPGQSSGPGQVAHVSRLRLVRDERLALEIVNGADPVLHLKEGEDIGLIQQAQVGQVQAGPTHYPPTYSYWNPFLTGMLIGGLRPAYYDPPRTIVVEQPPQGASGGSGGTSAARATTRVEGGSVSETPRAPAQRVTGISSAVSGRAGGTGAGNAVTGRNVTSGASSASSAGSSSAARSAGSSGSTGTSSAAS